MAASQAESVEPVRITSASGEGRLEFFERCPADVRLPVERFKVRLVDQDLSAVARIYADGPPSTLFAAMAAQWRGWPGVLSWEAPEGELRLSATSHRTGNLTLLVEVRSGPTDRDWTARATLAVEAGQLEELARQASAFFGGGPEDQE